MFCDGVTPCRACGRKYAHETGCAVPKLHESLDELIDSWMNWEYRPEDLMVQVRPRE